MLKQTLPFWLLAAAALAPAQETVIVRPKEIDTVLVNPGIGFMTFQRFNGDKLNQGTSWTEGHPIVYQEFHGSLANENHPDTSIAYLRIYWKYIEPERGQYNWDLIEKALETAHSRGQTLMLRVAPYGSDPVATDVPAWYRAMMGDEKGKFELKKWLTNPEASRYVRYFGGMIRALGARFDGNPDLESIDMAMVGAWGEGAGSDLLTEHTREALVNCYIEAFPKSLLVMLLTDEKTNKYGLQKRPVGWRVDCLGDMGGFSPTWSHMLDWYPQSIVNDGMADAWKKAPVTLEVCWVMQHWLDAGWDVDYIIDQSLKWHTSSFNGKSSPVPEKWRPNVERWLKHMGYRLVLRKFSYPSAVRPGSELAFQTWWENKGVAPCYHAFPVALRLSGPSGTEVVTTNADIRQWLPGDAIYDGSVKLPSNLRAGTYDLSIGILDPVTRQPKVKLAIAGVTPNGWYPLGKVELRDELPGKAAPGRNPAQR